MQSRRWVWLAIHILLWATEPCLAQTTRRDTEHHSALWFGAMTDWQLAGPWWLWLDGHYNDQAFLVLRGGVTHRLAGGTSLTLGYARVWTRPGAFERDEHRPWGQAVFPFRLAERWTLSQRLRIDYRVRERVGDGRVADGWVQVLRWRSQTALSYWLSRGEAAEWFLQGAIEFLADSGEDAGPNYLDQQRLSAMLGCKLAPVTLRAGYINRFVPGQSGVAPAHEHAAVLWLNYEYLRERPARAPPPRKVPVFGTP